jgi:amino acid adenylation domain-containing protein
VLVTVFAELLRRYTGQASTGVEFAAGANAACTVKLEHDDPVRVAVRQTHDLIQRSDRNVVEQADLNGGKFSYLNGPDALVGLHERTANTPIHLSATVNNGGLQGLIEYDPGAYQPFVIASIADHYPHLLRAALDDLDTPISDIEILSESDGQAFALWNRTARPYPHVRVDDLFRLQAAQSPNDNAITFRDEHLTYCEVADRVSLLAERLSSLGTTGDELVGIYMDRCAEMVIAMLATFQAGGAYLPLDPALPPDRIAFMLEDARPLVVITNSHLREKLPPTTARVICLDSSDLTLTGANQNSYENESDTVTPNRSLDRLAYVIYTSGSTGKPKGVEITHRALTNLLFATALEVPVGRGDVFLATATISFDISTFELFAPLVFGAHLVVAPRSVTVDGELLAETIRTSGATLLQSTPSGWRLLIEAGWTGQSGLKMLTAGEPLTLRLASQLLERGSDLWNLYGPTEGTVYATCRKVTREDTEITIGRTLANYQLQIVDRRQKPVPVGAVGELLISGLGVARGYRNRPDLTAQKFVRDLFLEQLAGTIYHTGDLARFLPTGEVDLLGRADNQVKIRGYRIELDEIEAVLDDHPSIRKSTVKVWDDGYGDQRLAAYFLPETKMVVTEAELRGYAQSILPPYMVPTIFISLKTLPLTPSGKVDRKALQPPQMIEAQAGMAETASTDLEQILLDCWRRVLRNPNLTVDDNFFEVGGHSLLAGRLFAQIASKLGTQKLPLGTLVEAPTVRALIRRIRDAETEKWRCLVPLEDQGSLAPLYLVHHLHGDVLMYWPLAKCLSPDRPVFGLQAPPVITENAGLRSFERLAELYIREILDRQPEGPYHLAGFSSGGGIAFEMASQLARAGKEVGVLVLIDSDINAPGPPLSKVGRYWKMFVRKLCKIAFKSKYELTFGIRHFVRRRAEYVRLLWKVYRLEHRPQHQRNDLTIEQALLLAEHAYHPRPYAGQALLIRFQEEAWKFGPDPWLGWSTLIPSGLEVVDVPGNHVSVLGPSQVRFLGDVVNAYLKGGPEELQMVKEEGAA